VLLHNKILSNDIQNQVKLIENSEQSGIPFSKILEEVGMSYNDLIYKNSYLEKYSGPKPYVLENFYKNSIDIPVVSFFSGCGGMDLGLEAAGFSHVACFEINEIFCKTIQRNRQKWRVFGPPTHEGDISNTDNIIDTLEKIIESPFSGLFVGGPPCQPFSIAANQRFTKVGDNFKRIGFAHEKNGNLFLDYIKLIIKFKPRAFLVENVVGLRDLDNGNQIKEAIIQLTKNGYYVDVPFILDASQYGIAQQRLRLFIIGSHTKKQFIPPKLRREVIGCGSVLSDNFKNISSLSNAEIRMHNASSIKRYSLLNYGARDHMGRVDRLDPMKPSKTVIAGGTSGGGRSHLHPEIPRTLSVRESARLQTFPDDFIFLGPTARQFTQVGNAVPPVLAAQIGHSIVRSFF
jgi:DNA (cytosine-5)-methyltransferase 1